MTSYNTNDQRQANFTIGQLKCIMAYHWSFVLKDTIIFVVNIVLITNSYSPLQETEVALDSSIQALEDEKLNEDLETQENKSLKDNIDKLFSITLFDNPIL